MNWFARLQNHFAASPLVAYALAGTSFINRIGGSAKLFLALYLRETLGIELASVGVLLSLYGAGLFAGSYLVAVVTDWVPARKLMLATLYASAVCLLMLCWVDTPVTLAIWLFLGGLADGGYRPSMQRVMMQNCGPLERTRAQALQRVAVNLGFALGGLIGGWFADADYRNVFIADAMTSIGAAWFLKWALDRADASGTPVFLSSDENIAGRWPYRDPPFLYFLFACLLLSSVYAQSESTMTNYLREYYLLSPFWVGVSFALNGMLVSLLQITITTRTEHWPVRRTMMLGAAVLTAGFAMLPLGAGLPVAGAITMALLSTTIYTIGEMLLMPPQAVLMMQRADSGRTGHYLALYNGVWGGRTMLAPLLGNSVYAAWGGDAVWLMCTLLGLLAMAVQYFAIRQMQVG